MKSKKGVTLLLLVLTVLIMIVILGTITYTSLNNFKMNQYYRMCADIELLDEKIALYYLQHQEDEADNFGLPIEDVQVSGDLVTAATTKGNVNYNPNNSGELYKINLSKLENLSLNNTSDFYIDKQSHTVYYAHGVEMDGEVYYTIPLDYQNSNVNEIGDSLYCTVDFDSDGGTEVSSQKIRPGQKAQEPKAPKKEGHEFLGWYYTPEGGEKTAFDFNTEVTENYSLHANWTDEAVMMARNNNYAFWQESIRTNLKNITFTKDTSLIPPNPLETWDIRADKTNGAPVTAYLQDSENLIVYSPYTIYANANAESYFELFSNLTSITFDNFDTSRVTNMTSMFNSSRKLVDLDLSHFDTSRVTSMSVMFGSCNQLASLDVSNFDTSKVTSMGTMFCFCSGLKSLDVSNFDTSNVTNMESMFNGCNQLASLDVSNFDTENVTKMNYMFNGCSKVTSLDVSNFDTSKVISMSGMFNACQKLTSLEVSNFDTSNVTNMSLMFASCNQLTNLDLSKFDVENVTNMSSMFNRCTHLTNLDISNFNTSKVTNMAAMFWGCSSLISLDVSGFDTKNVNNMGNMFRGCSAIENEFDLSRWNIASVTAFGAMFKDCSSPKIIMSGTNSIATSVDAMFQGCNASEIDISGIVGTNITSVKIMFDCMPTPKTIDISNFTFENVTESERFISNGSGPNDKIYVKDAAAQQFVLSQRSGWTAEDNVIIKNNQ